MRNTEPENPYDNREAYFVVSTKDNRTVSFQVNTRFGGVENTTTFNVTRNQPTRVAYNNDTVYVLDYADSDKAIWIQAEEGKKISVYVVNDESGSTDGFVALPCDAMKVPGDHRRYKYLILSAVHERASQFLMITCEGDTRVAVTPSSDISGSGNFDQNVFGPDSSAKSAKWKIFNNTLITAKRVLMIKADVDLTGTVIQSDKPLVVISHQCGQVPGDVTACHHMAVQIPPETTWGYTFLLNPLDARYSGDYYRFGVTTDISDRQVTNTEVTITCVEEGGSNATVEYQETLNSTQRQNWGTFETHPGNCSCRSRDNCSPKFCCLQATNPVVVTQYSYGHTADQACKPNVDRGDPFMSLIPPIVQYKRFYSLVPITRPIVHRRVGVSVYVDYFQPSRIMLDDAPFEADASLWQAIYCPREPSLICGYAIAKVLDEHPHIIYHADEGAAILVHSYGFLNESSYVLSGGMELQPIAGEFVIPSIVYIVYKNLISRYYHKLYYTCT